MDKDNGLALEGFRGSSFTDKQYNRLGGVVARTPTNKISDLEES